jgi:hypothetical protein
MAQLHTNHAFVSMDLLHKGYVTVKDLQTWYDVQESQIKRMRYISRMAQLTQDADNQKHANKPGRVQCKDHEHPLQRRETVGAGTYFCAICQSMKTEAGFVCVACGDEDPYVLCADCLENGVAGLPADPLKAQGVLYRGGADKRIISRRERKTRTSKPKPKPKPAPKRPAGPVDGKSYAYSDHEHKLHYSNTVWAGTYFCVVCMEMKSEAGYACDTCEDDFAVCPGCFVLGATSQVVEDKAKGIKYR